MSRWCPVVLTTNRPKARRVVARWCAGLVVIVLLSCQRESEPPVEPNPPADLPEEAAADDALNVVFITMDTTRADALGS